MLAGAKRFIHSFKYPKERAVLPTIANMSEYQSPYQPIRQRLDYSYHVDPSPSRALVQDTFITRHLSGPYTSSSDPLLLFTAGAMGAGKSHYLSRLPFKFILIDPDEIAATIPSFEDIGTAFERGSESERGLERGTRLRHEARLITEILLHAAMQRNLDIVIDGSLRSYQWYLAEIPALRKQFPQYRVELVHIHAPLSEVLRRAAKRESKTGRQVPSTLIERSWKDSRRAISVLGRKKIVDRVQMVDSSGDSPQLIYDSGKDPEWVFRGVPNETSRVDKFLDSVVENGEDIAKGKQDCKL